MGSPSKLKPPAGGLASTGRWVSYTGAGWTMGWAAGFLTSKGSSPHPSSMIGLFCTLGACVAVAK